MCNIIHQRHYNLLLRLDALFKFSSYAKDQQKYLGIIHGLTNRIIKKRNEEMKERDNISELKSKVVKINESDTKIAESKEQRIRYVRDDLDDIDDNDVGKFTAFSKLS
jgi:cytochrome P450 family 4